MTSLKSDQANLIQRVKVNQICPLSYLVVLMTTNDSQSFVIIQCCVISYTLFGLMCTNYILLFLPCLNNLCSQTKISPRFLSLPLQARENYPFPPHNVNYIFSQQKVRKIIEMKKWPKLNLQGYWWQVLINSTIFATIAFLVSVLFYHNLDSNNHSLT